MAEISEENDICSFSQDTIEGSEITQPFCSPLAFLDSYNFDCLLGNKSVSNSHELSLQDRNYSTFRCNSDDNDSDSDATCMPDNSQIPASWTSIDEHEIAKKHDLPITSQDLFTNSHEDADNASSISSCSDCIAISPSVQDIFFNKTEMKLALIKNKLKMSPTVTNLGQWKVFIEKLFGKLIKINENQKLEKEQLTQSQGFGSRLATRTHKLKRLIEISDKLETIISTLIQTSNNEEKVIDDESLDEIEQEKVIDDEPLDEIEQEKVIDDEPLDEIEQEKVIDDESLDELSDDMEQEEENVEVDAQKMSQRDWSPTVSLHLQPDGTLFDESGEKFSSITHWLQQRSGSQKISSGISNVTRQSSIEKVKTIFDVLHFDNISSLSTQMKQCKVVLTGENEIMSNLDCLPQNFWSNDFSKVILKPEFVQSIDRW